jgi:hypothetical protein
LPPIDTPIYPSSKRSEEFVTQFHGAEAPDRIFAPYREVLDHVVVLGERHLRHVLLSYMTYYNEARTHLSIDKGAPMPREVQSVGRILAKPHLGGLHHQYVRI